MKQATDTNRDEKLNQPKHTQGEWVQSGVNGIHTKDGNCIALTFGIGYGEDVRKANAQRIVKAVNVLSLIEKELKRAIDGIDKGFLTTSKQILNEILKQAEQK